ncbi:MAG: DUF58 domain-containing protein [Candidatus Stahlbacteria bacterium]|nr:DUF58 domain-containing protein [Candidatus Stahlbacteria bacterium]
MKHTYFDPNILSRIKSLELRAKFIVEGFLIGIHRSPYHGFSVEFAEHRPYQPGDEPKKVDWKLYARSERLYTKEFEEETNMLVYIILDVSNSMNYSSEGITKYEYAATVGASLAYLLIHQKDAVSLTLFDKEIRSYLPPSGTKLQFARMIKVLESTTPSEQTRIPEVLDTIGVKIKKRVQEFISGYKKAFHSHNIDYLLLPTSAAIEKSLVFYLARRKKMNLIR